MNDDQIRDAAHRLRDEVRDSVDLDDAYDRTRRDATRARTRTGAVATVVAALALVAGAVYLAPGDGDVEVAVDEESTTSSSTTTEPEPATTMPAPISLGAPDDGKDSVGLPVTADPSTGLTDGQQVSVSGSGFPPDVSVGVVMCTKEAGADEGGRGVDACNIGHFEQGTTDAQGSVTVQFQVRRIVLLDGQEVDCASEAGRCILGMGMLSDYDQSGGVAVDFDPSEPLPEPPTVSLSKTSGIADGESVTTTVTGVSPGSYLFVQQCTTAAPRCAPVAEVNADADGAFSGDVRLWRHFGTYFDPVTGASPNVDCAAEACVLRIEGETAGARQIPPVDIAFDPTRGARVPPTFALTEPGPFRNGDTVTLAVTDLAPQTYVDVSVCGPGGVPAGPTCLGWTGGQYDGGGTIDLPIHLDAQQGADACTDGCQLVLSVYQEGRTLGTNQGPPPLVPDPVAITVTP